MIKHMEDGSGAKAGYSRYEEKVHEKS